MPQSHSSPRSKVEMMSVKTSMDTRILLQAAGTGLELEWRHVYNVVYKATATSRTMNSLADARPQGRTVKLNQSRTWRLTHAPRCLDLALTPRLTQALFVRRGRSAADEGVKCKTGPSGNLHSEQCATGNIMPMKKRGRREGAGMLLGCVGEDNVCGAK